jgi:hypothetical protein
MMEPNVPSPPPSYHSQQHHQQQQQYQQQQQGYYQQQPILSTGSLDYNNQPGMGMSRGYPAYRPVNAAAGGVGVGAAGGMMTGIQTGEMEYMPRGYVPGLSASSSPRPHSYLMPHLREEDLTQSVSPSQHFFPAVYGGSNTDDLQKSVYAAGLSTDFGLPTGGKVSPSDSLHGNNPFLGASEGLNGPFNLNSTRANDLVIDESFGKELFQFENLSIRGNLSQSSLADNNSNTSNNPSRELDGYDPLQSHYNTLSEITTLASEGPSPRPLSGQFQQPLSESATPQSESYSSSVTNTNNNNNNNNEVNDKVEDPLIYAFSNLSIPSTSELSIPSEQSSVKEA